MKAWFRTYGWKFVLAFIVLGILMAFLVNLERKASGEASLLRPAAAAQHAAAPASPPSALSAASTSLPA